MKNTPVIISSYRSCSYWKMTGPLTAGLPSKNFIFGHAHWIPLIKKWGKSLGKNNFPQYLPFQDALIYTPKISQFSLAALQDGKDQKYSLKTADCTFSSLNPPHSWHGAMYWPSGTLGTPIGAPKQQYLPSKGEHFS